MRENCIFKTEKYINGCSALDAKNLDCQKCKFYKNEQMQAESIKKAEKLFQASLQR